MTKEERRQMAEKARQKREREAQAAALRQIRDDSRATPQDRLEAVKLLLREDLIEELRQIRYHPQATPGERLEAVKLLVEMENK